MSVSLALGVYGPRQSLPELISRTVWHTGMEEDCPLVSILFHSYELIPGNRVLQSES